MPSVNRDYLEAAELAQRLMSQDQPGRKAAWDLIWRKRTYRHWTKVLCLLMDVLVQTYGVEGARVAQRWLGALARQRTTQEGDPGYLGLALALRSLREVTDIKPWKEADGTAFERDIVALWVHELHKATWYHLLEQPVALVQLAHDVQCLNASAVQFAVTSLLDILLQEYNRNLHETFLHALHLLKDQLPVERLVVALHSEEPAVRNAAQHLLRLRADVTLSEALATENDEEGHVQPPEEQPASEQAEQYSVDELLDMLTGFQESRRQKATQTLIALGNRVPLTRLLDQLDHPNERVRAAVVQILGKQGKDTPVSALLLALSDPAGPVREVARQALRDLGEDVVEDTLAFVQSDTAGIVRAAAAHLLGAVAEQAPVDALVATLGDSDWHVRTAAVEALGKLGERVPIEALVACLYDSSERVQWAAAQALGKRDDEEGQVAVEPLLVDFASRYAIHPWYAVHTLGWLGKYAPAAPLRAALQEPDLSVRMEAVQALDTLGEPVPMELLLEALRSTDWHVRLKGAEALGRRNEQAPIALLVKWLYETDVYMRLGAVQALGELMPYAPIDPLIAALKDEHEGVREEAIRAVGKLGEHVPLEVLVTALNDEDKEVRRTATYQLEAWKGQASVEPLIAALKDREWEVREAAIMALKELGARVPLEIFLTALEDEMYLVHETAMGALAERAEQVPIDLFIRALGNKPNDLEAARRWAAGHTDYMRAWAAQALGKFGVQAPIELLLEALDDEDHSVRREAVGALGTLGELAPTEPIIATLGDDHPWVREAAFQVVEHHGQVGKFVAQESLLSALGNSEEQTRVAAMHALQQLYPDAMSGLVSDLTAIMLGQKAGTLFASLIQNRIADTIGDIGYPSPRYIEKLSQLLDWPYWEVRMKAAQALGKLRHPLPHATMRRLLALRDDPQSRGARTAANEVLDNVLSLETAIEDDEEPV